MKSKSKTIVDYDFKFVLNCINNLHPIILPKTVGPRYLAYLVSQGPTPTGPSTWFLQKLAFLHFFPHTLAGGDGVKYPIVGNFLFLQPQSYILFDFVLEKNVVTICLSNLNLFVK